MAADASGMTNLAAKPKVYELAGLLEGVRKFVVAEDWARAATDWEKFKKLQARYDAEMY